mmetsp:Transcript_10198/g.27980  ORF Transcript_10198/g.27980 Transcript_10198/m.27980 type:complete len:121 (+) Transcript_10198:465-827(+)
MFAKSSPLSLDCEVRYDCLCCVFLRCSFASIDPVQEFANHTIHSYIGTIVTTDQTSQHTRAIIAAFAIHDNRRWHHREFFSLGLPKLITEVTKGSSSVISAQTSPLQQRLERVLVTSSGA